MNITIIGTGYVGLVTGACLAQAGNDVMCLDIDATKVDLLNRGEVPIHEPGLEGLVSRNRAAGRLRFTTDAADAVTHGDVHFIAVGTPAGEDGSADLQHALAAAESIGRHMDRRCIIVNKSTVPVGTADRVRDTVSSALADREVEIPFSVVSNPEFLKEGSAVEDFMKADRIVIGSEDSDAVEVMRALYAPFSRHHEKLIVMDVRSAELTKYAANAMLATRISFMNEMANLAERMGADIEHVRCGIGSDHRIGYDFLYPGCGYGGSCFPKDIKALLQISRDSHEVELGVVRAVEAANEAQKRLPAAKLRAALDGDLGGRHIAVWGLAFKPNTDDMREASSRVLIDELLEAGATVTAYDPVAMEAAREIYAGRDAIGFAAGPMDALKDADALVIVTEWTEFRSPDFERMRQELKNPVIVDGRNLYEPAQLKRLGFVYHCIGRTST